MTLTRSRLPQPPTRRRRRPRPQAPSIEWYFTAGILTVTMLALVAPRPLVQQVSDSVQRQLAAVPIPGNPVSPPPSRDRYARDLFADLESAGVRAIGHAEGNLTPAGAKTSLYWGHPDPANFKPNQGWCSDQGRGGGDADLADRKCLERVQQRLSLLIKDFQNAGLTPDLHLEAFVNLADLYNQASPWVSRQFPKKYAEARAQGKRGEAAIVWARVEAFRRRGQIDASGLLSICRREQRPVSDWDCVAHDQRRRAQAIARVLGRFSVGVNLREPLPTGLLTQGFHPAHQGMDWAAAVGTPVGAALGGEVVKAGWGTGVDAGLGNLVEIRHSAGVRTVYGHGDRVLVQVGQWVEAGEPILAVGNTGNSTGPHLHFELYLDERAVDPQPFLRRRGAAGSG